MDQPAPDLFGLIAQVETKGNCKAVRFEPAIWQKLSAARTDSQKQIIQVIQNANSCSWGTALMIYSTSWGQCQLMGFNLYGPICQYGGNVIDFCDDQIAQLTTFQALVKAFALDGCTPQSLAASPQLRAHFGAVYNGSEQYATAIVEALNYFQIPVKE